MCAICQSGPELLIGVPAAGYVIARVRQALGLVAPDEPGADEAEAQAPAA